MRVLPLRPLLTCHPDPVDQTLKISSFLFIGTFLFPRRRRRLRSLSSTHGVMKRYRLLSFPGAPQPASTSVPADEPLHPTAKQSIQPSPPPLKIMRQDRDQGAPRPRGSPTPDRKDQILTAESMVVGDPRSRCPASVETMWNEFYRVCFRCKNKIRDEKPVFMFGYLRAFCSIECREEQMIIEGVVLTK